MDKITLVESLKRMEALENRLKELGVPSAAIPDVMEHIDEYVELREGLDQARTLQFHDDAYEMLRSMNASTTKNTYKFAGILRKFTEHIIKWTLSQASPSEQNNIQAIADHIPPFYSDEEED